MAGGGKLGTVFVELNLDSTDYERNQQKILQSATTTSLSIEKNYQNLGVTSNKMFDAMRQSVENSYAMITNSGKVSAEELVKVEEAKIAKIKALNEQQYGGQNQLMGQLKSNWMAISVAVVAAYEAVHQALDKTVFKAAELGSNMLKLSQQTALSVETISSLRYATAMTNTDFDMLVKGIGLFSKTLVSQDENGKNAASAMTALGITYKDAHGKMLPTEELLMQLADKFSTAKDSAEKTAYAMILFGRSGKEIVPFLNEGRDGIERYMNKAKELNGTFTKESAEAAHQFEKDLTTLKFAAEGLGISIGNFLIPTILKLFGLHKETNMNKLDEQIKTLQATINTPIGGTQGGFNSQGSFVFGRILQGDIDDAKKKLPALIAARDKIYKELYPPEKPKQTNDLPPLPGKPDDTIAKMAQAQLDWANKIDQLNPKLDHQDKIILQLWADAEKLRKEYGNQDWIRAGLYKGLTFETDKAAQIKQKKEFDDLYAYQESVRKSDEWLARQNSESLVKIKHQEVIDQQREVKDMYESYDTDMKAYEDNIKNVGVLEQNYTLSTVDATKKRIEIYQQEIDNQVQFFNLIKFNSAATDEMRQKTIDKIVETNKKMQEQNKIMEDRTAWGGYNKAIHSISDEYNNVGKNIEDATRSIFGSIESGINSFLDTTSSNFMKWGVMLKGIMNSILQQMIQVGITKPIVGALAGAMAPGTASASTGGLASAGMGLMQGAGYMVGPGIGMATGNNYASMGGMIGTGVGMAAGFGVGGSTALATLGGLAPGLASFLATSAFAIPIIGAIGAGIGLLISSLFGGDDTPKSFLNFKYNPKEYTKQVIDPQNDTYNPYGTIPSPKTHTETVKAGFSTTSLGASIDDKVLNKINSSFDEFRTKSKELFDGMGFDISGFSKKWNKEIETTGKTSKEVSSIIQSAMNSYVVFASGIKFGEYKEKGEKFEVTISRVVSEFGKMNSMLEILHQKMIPATQSGIALSQSLIKSLGGMDAATSKIDFFFKNFYTTEEQDKRSLEAANKSASEVFGGSIPKSRADFASIVESIDTTSEKGQKMFASMMNISSALDVIFKSQEAAAKTVSDNVAAIAQAETDAIKAQVDIINGYITNFTSLGNSVRQYQTSRSQSSMSMSDYQNQYSSLQGQFNGLSTSSPDYFNKSFDIQTQMLDTLKSMDSLAQTQIDQTKQTISQLTSLSQSIEKTIRSMYTGELAPTQSREYVQNQYNLLKGRTQSGDATDIQNFLDYTQEYLKFFKTFSGTDDYKTIFDNTVDDMSQVKVNVDDAVVTATDTLTTLQTYVSSTGSSVDTLNGKLNDLALSVDGVITKLNGATIVANTSNGVTNVTVTIDGKAIASAVATQITTGHDDLRKAVGTLTTDDARFRR